MTSGTKIGLALGVVAALGLAGVAAFYSGLGNAGNGSCSAAAKTAARMAPLAKGEVAAIEVRSAPQPEPELAFTGPDGKPLTLADFKGRTILVNLWATWCAPCLKEMPALEQVQRNGTNVNEYGVELGSMRFEAPKLVDLYGGPIVEMPGRVLIMLQQRSMAQMIERQLTRTELTHSTIGQPQIDGITAAGLALKEAGVLPASTDVKAAVDALLDRRFAATN